MYGLRRGTLRSSPTQRLVKPSGPAAIDWTHPRSKGLLWCVHDDATGRFADLVSGQNLPLQSGTFPGTKIANRWGEFTEFAGSANYTTSLSAISPLLRNYMLSARSYTAACLYNFNSNNFVGTGNIAGMLWEGGGGGVAGPFIFGTNGTSTLKGQIFSVESGGDGINYNLFAFNFPYDFFASQVLQFISYDATIPQYRFTYWYYGPNQGTPFPSFPWGEIMGPTAFCDDVLNETSRVDRTSAADYTFVGGSSTDMYLSWVAVWSKTTTRSEQLAIASAPFDNFIYPSQSAEIPVLFAPSAGTRVVQRRSFAASGMRVGSRQRRQ